MIQPVDQTAKKQQAICASKSKSLTTWTVMTTAAVFKLKRPKKIDMKHGQSSLRLKTWLKVTSFSNPLSTSQLGLDSVFQTSDSSLSLFLSYTWSSSFFSWISGQIMIVATIAKIKINRKMHQDPSQPKQCRNKGPYSDPKRKPNEPTPLYQEMALPCIFSVVHSRTFTAKQTKVPTSH